MMQQFIYSIPVFALIAILWSNKNWIVNRFKKKDVRRTIGEYDAVMSNEAVQFAINWRNRNHGTKQAEAVFRTNGKIISESTSYKEIQKKVFEID
ncbi:hypothetical protein AGMMS49982_02670 [Bacteroidia bacterium]|nr:hypothetical protein AGMMS49982_02670 [Bacteroidia bacterium]